MKEPSIVFGAPGHEHEFVINLPEFGTGNFDYADDMARQLSNLLNPGVYAVMSRGTRVEVRVPPELYYDFSTADTLAYVVSNLAGRKVPMKILGAEPVVFQCPEGHTHTAANSYERSKITTACLREKFLS